jgi:hypothetical protein
MYHRYSEALCSGCLHAVPVFRAFAHVQSLHLQCGALAYALVESPFQYWTCPAPAASGGLPALTALLHRHPRPNEPRAPLQVAAHRADRNASKHLKTYYNLSKRLK